MWICIQQASSFSILQRSYLNILLFEAFIQLSASLMKEVIDWEIEVFLPIRSAIVRGEARSKGLAWFIRMPNGTTFSCIVAAFSEFGDWHETENLWEGRRFSQ